MREFGVRCLAVMLRLNNSDSMNNNDVIVTVQNSQGTVLYRYCTEGGNTHRDRDSCFGDVAIMINY